MLVAIGARVTTSVGINDDGRRSMCVRPWFRGGPQRSKGTTRQTNGSVADMSEGVSTLSALLSAFVVHPCTAPLHRQCLMGHSPAPLAVLVRHTVGECWSGVVRHGVRLISPRIVFATCTPYHPLTNERPDVAALRSTPSLTNRMSPPPSCTMLGAAAAGPAVSRSSRRVGNTILRTGASPAPASPRPRRRPRR